MVDATQIVPEVVRSLLGELDLDSVLERVLDSAQRLTGARYAALGVLDEKRAGFERFITRGVDEQTRGRIGALPSGRGLLGELDLDSVLERVLDSAQRLTGARYAALGVLDEKRAGFERFITRGVDEQTRRRIGALPSGRGLLGVLMTQAAPLRLADIARHPLSVGLPPFHPPMRTFLGAPIVIADEPYGSLYLTEKPDGREFSEEDEQALMMLAGVAGLAIDHARRYTHTRQQRDELQRTLATLEATTEIANALGGQTDLDVVLELIANRGRDLVDARTLVIELLQGDRLLIAAGAGQLQPGVIGARIGIPGTVADQAMRSHCSQRLESEPNRSRFDSHGLGGLGVEAEAGLAVPLIFKGQTYGVMLALDRIDGGPAFTQADQRLLQAFAASAATAVATAQTVASATQRQRLAAAEEERRRWARELHDETLQSLSAMRIGLSNARRSADPALLAAATEETIDLLQESVANLRALITDLRPAALDELGIEAAIEALIERMARHGITVQASIDLADRADRRTQELEAAVYRIVQEALTNAVKHGNAKHARVEICERADAIHITVADDGAGFDPDAAHAGFGLRGMRERVHLLDGELTIDSAIGRGTTIEARLPAASQALAEGQAQHPEPPPEPPPVGAGGVRLEG